MSLYLAVELNNEIKKKLTQKQLILKQNIEGLEFEDPTRFHITVKFLSEDEANVNLAMDAIKLFKETYDPQKFEVIAKDFCKFPQGVIWVGVHNYMPLYDMKLQIDDCLRKVGFPLEEEKFKGYTPHITMSNHNDKEFDLETVKSLYGEGISITVDNISVWTGFKANDVYIHNKPYGIQFR